ncbi:MAG: tRNA uridine-5-carboxymethylaminomethyl(34) synthesis GTPase MnmE [Verrucomicrobia bacterium]|nr:tRNA uridine-5-carboxymethylaminomethyl(34) synthesis GTPase MnmE [Verrucomicrobiota bacterium]MCH8510028.1 tRNA uridine-5-carboxymethylaminomethyl(34) synthesis GTPase MnmE [Kiritimatiellia bacterium]
MATVRNSIGQDTIGQDTIAAVITPPGEGGVSIVRVSGPMAFSIADRCFHCAPPLPSQRLENTFVYGHVRSGNENIDEGILLMWRAPRSYTCEDVVELQCHGGVATATRVLRACLDAGARSADPGEFTRRAFLNGRIDLLQAEAIMDIVRAHSARAQAAAQQQLEGGLSRKFDAVYDALMLVAAQIEATLDFPEDELPESVPEKIRSEISSIQTQIQELLATWNEGHLLRDGAMVVLSGKPNVGKSTLLNALLGHDRAIVSDIPGTTRDSIEAEFVLDGVPLYLVDTAGLRESEDYVEREGINRTRKYMERADLHLHLIDMSQPADSESLEAFKALDPKKSILICNKTDLPRLFHVEQWPQVQRVEMALIEEKGVKELKKALKTLLSESIDLSARPHAVISERHRKVLESVEQEIQEVAGLIQTEDMEETLVLTIPALRDALKALGQVTGREYHEDLLDQVFSRFCIGK